MTRPARVVIDLDALRHNLSRVRELAPGARVMAIVKADAYGHGITRIARALTTVDAFGVACLEEARQLRNAGVQQRILLLEGPFNAAELEEISSLQLDIAVHDISQVEYLEAANPADPLVVWLKIDSGMHRLGFMPGDCEAVWQRLKNCRSVSDRMYVMSHFAVAGERDNPMTGDQLQCFMERSSAMDAEKSIANSAAIIAFSDSHLDWIRPGLMLYGVSPMSDSTSIDESLQPVMTLESQLIAVKQLRRGDRVGYGATYCCPEDMPVGVVAAGYGDGYPRHAPSGTPVLVNGERVSLVGRASMDMLTVDLRTQPDARVGNAVVLWGGRLPVEEIARHAGTIPYELLCGVHKRLQLLEHG